MSERLKTFFVETHEWNDSTSDLDLMEYYKYESGVYIGFEYDTISHRLHDTILTLAVF